METNKKRLNLRNVCADDIAAIFAIEQRAYEDGWSSDIMHTLLETQHYYGQVLECETDHSICGYCFFSVIFDECHLLNLCIKPEVQSQGLGRYLLDAIVASAADKGAKQVFLEVSESNLAAIRLYDAYGFTELGRRKGYYPTKTQGREDALVLVRNLEGSELK